MIPLDMQREPEDFEESVRIPGLRFLSKTPVPNGRQWKSHAYWQRIIKDLYSAYSGICAYSCHWIPADTGFTTVEHFKSKSRYPSLAYEWRNYRLVCGVLNGKKGDYEDVLDPFTISDGWFVIHFPSLLVRPGANLPTSVLDLVDSTISRLGLNDAGTCLQARRSWLRAYIQKALPLSYLEENAPFLAKELRRQGLETSIGSMMRY